LTDNFATALITNSSNDLPLGTLAITKTIDEAVASNQKNKDLLPAGEKVTKERNLEELDVELNLDDINDDLLEKADQIKLTEDELEELERQENKNSVIKDHEKDLKELEKLEEDIAAAEAKLNEVKVDEDKFLEQQSLDKIEEKDIKMSTDTFESLDEIEKENGRKYLDEDLNSAENPFGLTEFDLEEIDELLNTNTAQ